MSISYSKNILITGASSGIGKALAELYASPGITLVLIALSQSRLEEVSKICQAKGANVISKILDVSDHEVMNEFITEIDESFPIDLVIANAGIGRGKRPDTWETADRIIKIDLYGVLNTVLPLIPGMKKRGRGHIAVVSSLAAYRSYPGRGTYSGSKAAIMAFCDDWRVQLSPFGVFVSTICPGFVQTRLTDQNAHPMPLIMSAEKAAKIIVKSLAKKKSIIAFPWPTFMVARLMQILPVRLTDFIIKRLTNYVY